MKPEEFFKSKQQLARYYYCKELAEKLIDYQKKGFIIFDDNDEAITGDLKFNYNPEETDWLIFSVSTQGCRYGIVDIEWEEYPWIMSKADIKAAFDGYSIVDPKYIIKLKL